jgi:hypothetical protein
MSTSFNRFTITFHSILNNNFNSEPRGFEETGFLDQQLILNQQFIIYFISKCHSMLKFFVVTLVIFNFFIVQ